MHVSCSIFKIFGEDARELSEPEDQDYYGIGSRPASPRSQSLKASVGFRV